MTSTPDQEVFTQHASEAAFLWTLRDRAVLSPMYDLGALARLDERVEAHVDALRLAGDAGRAVADDAAGDGIGETFVAAVLAIERGDLAALRGLLDDSDDVQSALRAVTSASGWCRARDVRGVMLPLCNAKSPRLRYLALAACAAHRIDPEAALLPLLADDNRSVKARALRVAGELARMDLLGALTFELADDHDDCRYHAAWSAALLGVAGAAPTLFELALESPQHARGAAAMALRRADASQAREWLKRLAPRVDRRVVVEAVAARGDPVHVPMLLEWIDDPELARAVGAALTTITGVDLGSEGLVADAPGVDAMPNEDPRDERVSLDPDDGLPWPDAAATRAWWTHCANRFEVGSRLLLGRPMERPWLKQVLCEGTQPLRRVAAIESSLRHRRRALFEVRAPAWRQRHELFSSATLVGERGM